MSRQKYISRDNRMRIARNLRAIADAIECGHTDYLLGLNLYCALTGSEDESKDGEPASFDQDLRSENPLNEAVELVGKNHSAGIYARVLIGIYAHGRWTSAMNHLITESIKSGKG